jgi:hypothetical protein
MNEEHLEDFPIDLDNLTEEKMIDLYKYYLMKGEVHATKIIAQKLEGYK